VVTGLQRIVGQAGTALADFNRDGQVQVGGEIWQAHASQPLQQGDKVVVTSVSGLWLSVEKESN
jgi:membrane-bound serine protease (ClpP class)